MRIRRSPRSSNTPGVITDQRTIDASGEEWEPGHVYWFDATIDSDGKRHTDIGVEVEPEDIVALFNALVKYYAACAANRKAALDAIQEAISNKKKAPTAADVFQDIRFIISSCETDPDQPDWKRPRPIWTYFQRTE